MSTANPIDELRAAVEDAAAELRDGAAPPRARPSLERPKQAGFGDYATNAAMLLAPALKAPPREIAERLGAALGRAARRPAGARRGRRARVPQPLPGRRLVRRRGRPGAGAGDGYGGGRAEPREKIQVEFVSANPTGPLTAASGRHAAPSATRCGGCCASRATRSRASTTSTTRAARSTASAQSIVARARGEEPPEDGYQGDYVQELADAIPGAAEHDRRRGGRARASSSLIERIRGTLAEYRVEFDSWFLERSLARRRPVARCSAASRAWTSRAPPTAPTARCGCARRPFGDDKDRVIVRSTGAPDVLRLRRRLHGVQARARLRAAVHRPRLRPPRLHGADEGDHGLARRRSGPARDPDPAVRAHRRARRARVDVQAPRRLHHARRPDRRDRRRRDALLHAPALAGLDGRPGPGPRASASRPRTPSTTSSTRTPGSPRSSTRRRGAGGRGGRRSRRPLEPAERELVRKLLAFPGEVAEAAERRAPHRIATYALELAQAFTAFYRDCHGAATRSRRSSRRSGSASCVATKRTIAARWTCSGSQPPSRCEPRGRSRRRTRRPARGRAR